MDPMEVHQNLMNQMATSANNLFNLAVAKSQLEKEKSLFDIQKKKALLELDEMEYTHSPEQREAAKNLTTSRIALALAGINHKNLLVESEISKRTREFEQYNKEKNIVEGFLSGKVKLPPGQSLRFGKVSIGNKADDYNWNNDTSNEPKATPTGEDDFIDSIFNDSQETAKSNNAFSM